jgi:hypothetical protein
MTLFSVATAIKVYFSSPYTRHGWLADAFKDDPSCPSLQVATPEDIDPT